MAEGMRVDPDLNFIRYMKSAGGDTLKKCFQCATCSVVCPLASDSKPFPRKEMIWAQWGLKDKLVADPDVMLCHQCGDCTAYCPRGAKPGDVLGAIRAYAYSHYGYPGFLAKLCSSGKNLPIMILIPAILILAVWYLGGGMHIPDAEALAHEGFGHFFAAGTTFGFTNNVLLIDMIFVPAFLFAVFASFKGAATMWKQMVANTGGASQNFRPSAKQFVIDFLWPSIVETVKHKRFNECGANKGRVTGHLPLLLAFIGLFLVTNYAFIVKDFIGLINPALHAPIAQANPVKILANISAIAMIVGVGILWANRSKTEEEQGASPTFYDWFLIGIIMSVGVTGLVAEITRLIGVGVLAYLFYYFHLVSVFMLFFYMPYTKFAHMVYRTVAMAFERYRESGFVKKEAS